MTAAAGTHHLRQRDFVHLADIKPRSAGHIAWERRRHRQAHWLVECLAEFMGVFFYVYAGVGSTASYLLANTAQLNGLGSLFQIGTAYAFGILFALIVCAPTSGGHFNPAMTIAFTLMGRCTYSVVTPAHADYLAGHLAHEEHSQGIVRGGSVSPGLDEKSREQTIEHV